MTQDLLGKRVLFMAPRFFGYDQDIEAELQRRGATVVRLIDRPFASPLMTAVTKLAPELVSVGAKRQYSAAIASAGGSFDLIFVINGQTLAGPVLDQLRSDNPRARFVLYLWDSLDNRRSVQPNLGRYDQVFGFDATDARAYGFRHRPLFFGPAFDSSSQDELLYDISFVGTAHSDRAPIVHAVDRNLPSSASRFWYLYLQAPWVYRYYGLRQPGFRAVPRAFVHFDGLPKPEIGRIFRQSRAVLDIEHPLQRGLTMRTIETLGASKKLVTTNRHVAEADFYDPQNILIVDRHDIGCIDRDFLETEFRPLPPVVRRRYSLAGWLDEILEGAEVNATDPTLQPSGIGHCLGD
jgi:hypothetical protein